MLSAKYFLNQLNILGVDFYTGVPDSQLKSLCNAIYRDTQLGVNHIIAANEGGAVGLAAGHYLATGKPALVYMQNSGIGNAMNPIVSLTDEHIYKIPMVFVIGWRGEPRIKDEPQHIFQGMITEKLLDILHIPYFILSENTEEVDINKYMECLQEFILQERSVAFIVKKNTFSEEIVSYSNSYSMTREEALEVIISEEVEPSIYVSTTGKLSRELFELRERRNETHETDFLTVGSMGHASMITLGIALEKKGCCVWCLDGDGAAVMHMGNMALLANTKCKNIVHVIFNNGAHETVGGMPVIYGQIDFCGVAKALGYQTAEKASDMDGLREALCRIRTTTGPAFLELKISLESRQNLGRPSNTPLENKQLLMKFITPKDKKETTI